MFKSEYLVVKNCPNTGFSQTVPTDGFRSGKSPPPPEFVAVRTKGKYLTGRQRRDVVARLLWELKDHGPTTKFPRGVVTAVTLEFRVSHDTIRRVWKRAVENFNDPDVKQFCASPQKINNCGRPHKWNCD